MFELLERRLPTSDYRFPHLIAARDVGIDEGLTEDHTQLSKFGTFDNTDQLNTSMRVEEYETNKTYLIIGNDEANEVVKE